MISVTHAGHTLSFPEVFGSPNVVFNSKPIPSSRLWAVLEQHLAHGTKPSAEELIEIGAESEIFRWDMSTIMVHTFNPRKTDELLSDNVYRRRDRQRIRPLVGEFNIVIAKIEGDVVPSTVRALHTVAESLGLYPVGMNTNKVYYAPDPEAVFAAFGSRDWVRIGVMMKRPGGSCVDLCLGSTS